MTEREKPKVKVGLLVSGTEFEALQFVERIHPGKYDGVASVLRDYSLGQALQAHEHAKSDVMQAERVISRESQGRQRS